MISQAVALSGIEYSDAVSALRKRLATETNATLAPDMFDNAALQGSLILMDFFTFLSPSCLFSSQTSLLVCPLPPATIESSSKAQGLLPHVLYPPDKVNSPDMLYHQG